MQNYLVFTSANKDIECFSDPQQIYSWKSKIMSEESIKNPPRSNNTFAPSLSYYRSLPQAKFAGNCLSLSSFSLHWNVSNLYIPYTLHTWSRDLNTSFTLENYLFGALKLTKNADSDKYEYTGYRIRFDARSQLSLLDGS